MNLQTIRMGTAAAEDEAYFRSLTSRIIATREKFKKDLTEMGFVFPDSRANFVFAKHPEHSGEELFQKLRKRGIYVRHWNKPLIGEYLRITIGTEEEMAAVTQALREIVNAE